jgi:hypothetical protein
VPNVWSKVRFSPISTITCLIGVCGAGSVHTTSTDCWVEHAESPSDTATVIVARPTLVQVKLGVVAAASPTLPEVAVQWKVSGAGTRSTSTALAWSAIVLPNATSAGVASSSSIRGHTFSVPLTSTLPVPGCSTQVMWTDTGVTAPGRTSNVALPVQSPPPPAIPLRSVIW